MVDEAKRNPEIFAGMYQQRPYMVTGDFFSPDDFEIVDHTPKNCGIYASIDLALSEKQSADATVIMIAGMAEDGTLYIMHMHSTRCSPEKTIQNLQMLHDEYKFRELLIEDSPAEKVFRDLCHKVFRQQGRPLPLMPMPTRGRDKAARAQAARGLAKMGGIKFVKGDWNAEALRELSEFPMARHDDIVDTLAILGQRAAKMGTTGAAHTPAIAPPVRGLIQEINGQQFLRQPLNELFAENETLNIGRQRRI